MSFYFDDDDDLGQTATGGGLKVELDEDNFLCDNCGGTDSYVDHTTGNLFCSTCFTQSQTITATQEEDGLDYEEVMGMAARTKGGHIMHKKLYDVRKGRRKKKPLEDYDKSQPLPDLKKCISGFQTVLREGAKEIGQILEMDEEEQEAYLNTIRTVWMAFLKAWGDGAERYGQLYPTIRFSLRDCFLSSVHRHQIKLVLTYKAAKEMEAELKEKEKENVEEDEYSNEEDYESNPPEPVVPESFPSSEQANEQTSEGIVLKGRNVRNIRQLANCFPKGREEAALSLNVSLELATALLWIPIARIGIIPGQVINWIANGSLPFVNAFDNLLSQEEQAKLNLIKVFFRMDKPPKASAIEKKAANLAVAAGLKSASSLAYGIHTERIGRETNGETTSGAERQVRSKNTGKPNDESIRRIRFVSSDCVPIMIGRLVADLGLGQRVLDIALSLTGIQPAKNSKTKDQPAHEQWLPPPLKQAHPDWVDTPEYALAVIVVACKMCPGWDKWSFYTSNCPQKPSEPQHEKIKAETNYQDENWDTQSESDIHDKFKARSIPWNEGQFRLVRNDTLKDYLDFFEKNVRQRTRRNGPRFEALVSALEKPCQKHDDSAETRSNTNLESENGRTEILLPRTMSSKASKARKLHPGFAQGFFPYISYPNYESHTTKKQPFEKRNPVKKLTQDPFHPFYTRLIEYISYKTHVDAFRIHEIVACLDEEVVALCEGRNFFDDNKVVDSPKKKRARTKRGLPSLGVMLNPANSFARYTTYAPQDLLEVPGEQANDSSVQADIHIPAPDQNIRTPAPEAFNFEGIFDFGSVQPESENYKDTEEEEVIQYAEV